MLVCLNRSAVTVIILFFSIVFFIIPAKSQESDLSYFADGVVAFDDNDYEGAVGFFKQAIELNPSHLEYQYYLGLTYTRLEKDEEALAIFESIVDKDPVNYVKAFFDITSLYSRQEKYQKAIEALNRAEHITTSEMPEKADHQIARICLERGYIYKKIQDYEQAIQNFDRAKMLDPKLTQMVTYDKGAIYLETETFDRAEEMFSEAIDVNPETPLAESARQAISNVKIQKRTHKPWYVTTSLTWGYDDNVPLNPLEGLTPGAGPVADEGDQFQTLLLKGGYRFDNWKDKDIEVGAGYSLYVTGYKEWVQNNVLAHIPYLYLQYNKKDVFFRLEYDFSYYNAGSSSNTPGDLFFLRLDGYESKLRMNSIISTLTILEPYNLKSEILFIYEDKQYLDGVTPNASHYSGGIIQSYKFPNIDCYPRLGYRYGEEIASDDDSTYQYHQGQIGISSSLYWGIIGDISLTYVKADYHPRTDKTYITSISLNRPFRDNILLQLFYNHTQNRSNWQGPNDPHKFRKNVYLISATFMF